MLPNLILALEALIRERDCSKSPGHTQIPAILLAEIVPLQLVLMSFLIPSFIDS